MVYFTREYQKFFQQLTKNNSKTWFDANRQRYEEHVKQPFTALVEVMIGLIRAEDPEVAIAAKDAVFRINRDIRFSKEKSPYKTHMAANVSKQGRKSKEWPGFYFQFSADRVTVGGGTYITEPPALYKIRKTIIGDLPSFKRLVTAKAFTSKYGSLQGERNKIMPPEFRQWVAKEPMVANKQFYFMSDLDAGVLLEKALPDRLMTYYRAGSDINSFLKSAMISR
ncbi:MAG: DUF2461 domain-containing protein [Pyrinomonadaceae bacterium]|nr:DUF2461 domain-containing protein [Pyrinomonadaceae bacterium]